MKREFEHREVISENSKLLLILWVHWKSWRLLSNYTTKILELLKNYINLKCLINMYFV